MAEIGAIIEGKYKIHKIIGKGGMSFVYLISEIENNKQWALKEIRKKSSKKKDEIIVNSLLTEAKLLKKLDHPSIPKIIDILEDGNSIYIIMDYIKGLSLDKIILENGHQQEETVIDWAKQICCVLEYLHSRKVAIIYRDMKPANIMLTFDGKIKIIDFGIAREYKEINLVDTDILGTKGYASPEQHGARQTDQRSDIYTLGMTLHHLFTGEDPRKKGYKYFSVRHWRPELSERIEAIIDKCTIIDSEKRYQNCAALMCDLKNMKCIKKTNKKTKNIMRKASPFIVGSVIFLTIIFAGFQEMITNPNNSYFNMLVAVSSSFEEKTMNYKQVSELLTFISLVFFVVILVLFILLICIKKNYNRVKINGTIIRSNKNN